MPTDMDSDVLLTHFCLRNVGDNDVRSDLTRSVDDRRSLAPQVYV
jgi:hypothetical protein